MHTRSSGSAYLYESPETCVPVLARSTSRVDVVTSAVRTSLWVLLATRAEPGQGHCAQDQVTGTLVRGSVEIPVLANEECRQNDSEHHS